MRAHALLALCAVLPACVSAASAVHVTDTPKTFSNPPPSDPRIVVAIVRDKSQLHEAEQQPTYVMRDSKGVRHACYVRNATAGAATSHALQPADEAPAQVPPSFTKSPFELLDKLTGLCLYRQEGLWTYEFCYRKQVRQMRQVKSGKTEEFSCGKYTGDDAQAEDIKVDTTTQNVPLNYVRHDFAGGADCTLTGAQRTAEVRFMCMRDAADNIITAVKEFPTCHYVLTVATPFLCKAPEFKPPPEATTTILCVPEPSGSDSSSSAGALQAVGGSSGEEAGGASNDEEGGATGEGRRDDGTADGGRELGDAARQRGGTRDEL